MKILKSHLLKYDVLDCATLSDVVSKKGVIVTEIEDLSGKVPHVGYGGASKSTYVSPKTGNTVYVLERNGWYAGDAYVNDVWQFDCDFTAEEANDFIKSEDAISKKWTKKEQEEEK